MSKPRRPRHSVRFWLMWPGLFLYFTGSHRARVAVICDNQILLVRDRSNVWFDDDRWAIPGGGIRARETPAQGAARELHEEVGIRAEPTAFHLLSEELVSEYGLRYRSFFMSLRLNELPNLTLEQSEIADAEWFDIAAAQHMDLKKEARRVLDLLVQTP